MKKAFSTFMLCLLIPLVVACQAEAPAPGIEPTSVAATVLPTQKPTSVGNGGDAPTVPADLSDLVITLERTRCRGFCPVYSVTIYGDGTVQYVGEEFVEVVGEQTAQISDESLRALVQQFYDADFFGMQDRYEAEITDLPSTTTTFTLNGETKSVYNYAGAPEALLELEQEINEVSGAEVWVGEIQTP